MRVFPILSPYLPSPLSPSVYIYSIHLLMITFVSWVQSLRKDCSLYEGIQLLELKVLLFFVIIRLALSTPQRTLGYPSYPSYPDMVVLLTLNARLVRSCPYTIVLLTLFYIEAGGFFLYPCWQADALCTLANPGRCGAYSLQVRGFGRWRSEIRTRWIRQRCSQRRCPQQVEIEACSKKDSSMGGGRVERKRKRKR